MNLTDDELVTKALEAVNNSNKEKDNQTEDVDSAYETESDPSEDYLPTEGEGLEGDGEKPVEDSIDYKEKYYTEKQKRKNILANQDRLLKQNEFLKTKLESSVDSNVSLYEETLKKELETTKGLKAHFKSINDIDSEVECDAIQAQLIYKLNDLNKEKTQYANHQQEQFVENEVPNEYVGEYEYEDEDSSYIEEWLESHPELTEGSKKYNPSVVKKLERFTKALDNELWLAGRKDEILTPEYLNAVDNYLHSIKYSKPANAYSSSNVGGVKNSSPKSNNKTVILTEADKGFIREGLISEEKMIEWKLNGKIK